ncbi:hypothetical protein BDV23DRAFT_152863 [Aspergillus alliaceus]|uniref:C6 zinc finger domain protein n=1 Tax=Petromyces alliaceus TaxID=209559 RepID=A0A5N7CC47_PETAA|nr:hypothetical protein BDV23DRAFT_152863 [Aspergillus alliaceus]
MPLPIVTARRKNFPSSATIHINLNLPGMRVRERRYFTFFQSYTMPMVVGYFHSEAWEKIVLQLGQTEPAVCHAIAALGALHEFTEDNGMPNGELERKSCHRYSALDQYNRAISALYQRLGSNDPHFRLVTLACCIVFIFFEFLQENYGAALTHLDNGLRILANPRGTTARSSIPRSLYDQDASSLPEDALVRALARLDVQAAHFDSSSNPSLWPAEVHISEIQSKHLELSNIHDAKEKLDPIINNIFRFRTKCDIVLRDPSGDHFDLHVEYQNMRLNLSDHMAAFDRFTARFCPRTVKEHRGIDLIRLHHLIMTLLLDTMLSLSEMVYDKYLPQMTKCVYMCERIINNLQAEYGNRPPTVLMDMGVILILSWLAIKCRDFKIRYRALDLLRTWPHREGPNLSTDFFCSCREAIEIEREGIGRAGLLPEASRVRGISTRKLEGRNAILHYTMSDPEKQRLEIRERFFVMDPGSSGKRNMKI